MRDLVRQLVDDARRSGDRVGVDGRPAAPTLAADVIRLARVATAIHLADAGAAHAAAASGPEVRLAMREPAG